MYLLDTAVLADLRKAKWDAGLTPLARWAQPVPPAHLFMSAISLLELEGGVLQAQKRDPEGATALSDWLNTQVTRIFDGRILPVDAAVVRRRTGLHYADGRDALIAATCLEHGLTLVTKRPSAYRAGRVKLLNPYDAVSIGRIDDKAEWTVEARSAPNWLRNLFLRF